VSRTQSAVSARLKKHRLAHAAAPAPAPAPARRASSLQRLLASAGSRALAAATPPLGPRSEPRISDALPPAAVAAAEARVRSAVAAQVAQLRVVADRESRAKASGVKVQQLLEGWATIFSQSGAADAPPPSGRLGSAAAEPARRVRAPGTVAPREPLAAAATAAPLAFAPTPDVAALSNAQLKAMLAQARCAGGACVERSELLALAHASLGRWEVARILACEALPAPQRHFAVLRLSPALLAGGRAPSGGDSCVTREARGAFRRLSLAAHPDKCTAEGAHDAFRLLQAALHHFQIDSSR